MTNVRTTASRPGTDLVEAGVTAAVGAAWSALPDYVESPSRRRGIRAALLVAGGAVVGVRATSRSASDDSAGAGVDAGTSTDMADDHTTTGTTAPDHTTAPDGRTPWASIPEKWQPVALAGATAATVGMVTGSLVLGQKIDDAFARRLANAGLRRPYTAVGLTWGVAALLLARLDPGA